MGSSDSGGAGMVDSRTGSIVWVRRRNGSWWPGKILGPDELSASHLMSPRSGTPVKLLGREDASVDWYNLEKSKRVKAFRCGEFDDCIERAEASVGLPVKKREKYARREDAILHALELEKQFHVKNYGKVASSNSLRENSSDSERKNLATSSVPLGNGNGKLGHHQLFQLVKKVDMSNALERNSPLFEQKPRDATCPRLREQNTEASHQMRGFGRRTVPVNGMTYASAPDDDSKRMAVDDHAHNALVNNPCLGNSSDSDSRDSIGRGKRLLEDFVGESPPKRHDTYRAVLPDHSLQPDGDFISMFEKEQSADSVHRSIYFPSGSLDIFDTDHGPQGQMETSVSRFEVGNSHLQHGTFGEESTSVSSEETESDSSETHSLEQHVDAGMMQSDAETCIRVQPSTFDGLEMSGGHESTSSGESDELSLDDRSQFYSQGPNPSGFGVSKWQLKGKRNIRNFSKRAMDRLTHRTYEGRGRSLTQRAPNRSSSYYHEIDYNNDVDFIEDDFNFHTERFGGRGYLASKPASKRQYFVGQNMIDWEDLAWGRPFRGYWEDRGQNGHDMLIDVDVNVQANRQGEHVPWVSLMSRLNGKAIIGHPIQIEALEDGSTDIFVSTSDTSRVPPVWRTARRTASFRVPRPHMSSQIDGDEVAENQCIHQSGKAQSKKSVASSSSRKGCLMKKSQLRGMKKKPLKKGNPSLNQKTKALSSIGYDPKMSNKRRDKGTSYYMDGMIKPVDAGPPAVACIPVKLVFSRLLEAIGRLPSGSVMVKHKGRNPP